MYTRTYSHNAMSMFAVHYRDSAGSDYVCC